MGCSSAISTETFRMGRAPLAATLFGLYGVWPIIILAILSFAALLAGFLIDLRWAVVFLMIIFIFSPALLCYLYFYHGLRPVTALNAVSHKIHFGEKDIQIEVFKEESDHEDSDHPEPSEAAAQEKTDVLKSPEPVAEIPVDYTKHIPYASVRACLPGRSGYILLIDATEKGFLWFPYAAFSSPTLLQELLERLKNKITNDIPLPQ